MVQDEDFITVAGAARLAGVSDATVRRWIRQDRLNKYTDGRGRTWLDRREVDHLLKPAPADAEAGA